MEASDPMCRQPQKIEFALPPWLASCSASYRTSANIADRMRFVIGAARRNVVEETGGPFAAAVFESDSGKLVSLGVNLVTTEGLSMLHAEMVAFAVAQRVLNTYDLGGAGLPRHELVASSEPCAMCYGAIPWSGVQRVICGARDSDARAIGFDEGPKARNWRDALASRGIETICDVERSAAVEVFREYANRGGRIYNSRESAA